MALIIKDRVKEITTSTGTGDVSLGGASATFDAFQSVMSNGDTTFYAIVHTESGVDEWEVGLGTFNTGGTLSRTTVYSGSNGTSAVNFSSGNKDVFMTYPASNAMYKDASGNVDLEGYVDFNPINHPTHAEGRVYYDTVHKTLSYQSDITDVEHELGIEEHVRVYNSTGSTIAKGKPVYWSGNQNDVPTIALGNATEESKYNVQGLTAGDIANNSYGYVIVSGLVDGIDTSSLTAGQNVFMGLTDGALQNASPTYPNYPMCIGWVVKSDATDGIILVNQQNHSVNSFRVRTSAHIGDDLIVGGDLTVLGSQTIASSENVSIANAWNYFNSGDTIGALNTNFSGSGLNDASFTGHFTGTVSTTYYVRIDGVGTGTGGVDTFEWSTDNFATTVATGVDITGDDQLIHSTDNIAVKFEATTGHTSGDTWTGTATPLDVDTGFATNRNTGTSGVGYTHMGIYFDVSTGKWTVFDEYDPEPDGTIDTSHSSFSYGTLKADTFEGSLSGNATTSSSTTGNAATATALQNSRTISLTGDVSGSASFDGTANATITATVADDSHNHVISNVDGLQSALDAKLPLAGGTMTGNITFNSTQTFDGRDVSADGTKLDGIEAGATGDQTAAEILTAIKTVDGVGSNLDADLLDGQQGSYYLNTGTTFSGDVSGTYNNIVVANDSHSHSNYITSNANDSMSGILTFTSTNNAFAEYNGSGTAPYLRFKTSGTNNGYIQFESNGNAYFWNDRANQGIRVQSGASGLSWYDGGAYRTVWHSANDGSGSSLDADLLDGQHGNYYLNYNNFTNTPSIPSAPNNATITLSAGTGLSGGGNFTTDQSSNETITFNLTAPYTYIDTATGNYGTIKVDDDRGVSWAGYAIRDDWVFMSNGAAEAGIFNDTDDEWGIKMFQNARTALYYNGDEQFRTESAGVSTDRGMRIGAFGNPHNANALEIAGGTSEKIVLSGASDPYIRWQEGTTDRFYIQWRSANNAPLIRNQESGDFDIRGNNAVSLRLRDNNDSIRGYVHANTSNNVGFLDSGGSWAVRHINDQGTYFYTDGGTEEFKVGRDIVSGTYGTVETRTTKNNYGGYSINGQWVFMSNGAGVSGIFNDTDNEWAAIFRQNAEVELYHNGSLAMETIGAGGIRVGSTTSSDIYMQDTDNGERRIHCNSNNLGFLDSSNAWSFYSVDNGDVYARKSLYVDSANDQKIILQGSSNPYIRFREGTTDRFYIQWVAGSNAPVFHNNEGANFQFRSYTTGSSTNIQLMASDGDLYGSVHGTHNNEIGFLDQDGNWAYRHARDSLHEWSINNGVEMSLSTSTLDLKNNTITNVEDIYLNDRIYHNGDTNTYLQFEANDVFRIVIAGAEVMEWGNNYARLNDNDTLRLGSGSDFRMYHNGSHNYFRNYNHSVGNIYFQGENTSGSNHALVYMYTATSRTYVSLFENAEERLRTTDTGITVYGDVNSTSDIRYKKNIETIDNAVDKVKALRGVTFDWDNEAFEASGEEVQKPNFTHRATGVIAQDVEKVLPEAVREDANTGFKNVTYGNMVGLLIEAIKEQQEQIDMLTQKLNEMENK